MKRNGGPGYREADCTKRIHSYGTVYELLEHSGFIDMRAESIYFNRRECPDAVIGSRVSFCAREGPKGLNAVSIRLESGFSDEEGRIVTFNSDKATGTVELKDGHKVYFKTRRSLSIYAGMLCVCVYSKASGRPAAYGISPIVFEFSLTPSNYNQIFPSRLSFESINNVLEGWISEKADDFRFDGDMLVLVFFFQQSAIRAWDVLNEISHYRKVCIF